jgi:hypothetical protein
VIDMPYGASCYYLGISICAHVLMWKVVTPQARLAYDRFAPYGVLEWAL